MWLEVSEYIINTEHIAAIDTKLSYIIMGHGYALELDHAAAEALANYLRQRAGAYRKLDGCRLLPPGVG